MANTPPPYTDITGISRAVMKDNSQVILSEYDGNARPGELVVNLESSPPALYVGDNLGQLNSIGGGGGSVGATGPTGATGATGPAGIGGDTGDLTITNTTIAAPATEDIYLQTTDADGNNRSSIAVKAFRPNTGEQFSEVEIITDGPPDEYSFSATDWTTASWSEVGGQGRLTFNDSPDIVQLYQSSIKGISNILSMSINGGDRIPGSMNTTDGVSEITFNTELPLVNPTTITAITFYIVSRGYINISNSDSRVRSGGSLYLEATSSVILTSEDGAIYIETQGGNEVAIGVNYDKYWYFYANGSIEFPDATIQTTAWSGGRVVLAPTASTGASGDTLGDIAFDAGFYYYCTADYTDGLANIWKRVAWDAGTW